MIQQFLIDLCEIFLEKKPKYLATFKAILKTITFASGYCGFLLYILVENWASLGEKWATFGENWATFDSKIWLHCFM